MHYQISECNRGRGDEPECVLSRERIVIGEESALFQLTGIIINERHLRKLE
jgi:hypothetical protein